MKQYCHYQAPIGKLLLVGENGLLEKLFFPNSAKACRIEEDWQQNERVFQDILQQLKDYFAGKLKTFKVEMHLEGTDFQRQVWNTLQQIPYGETASYGDIAKRIHNPKACRAVGGANNKNPIPIIIP